ncbi:hypothetical protein BG000_003817 [Podila horticola]|nr:hypothetical protein BG000_003817 [Podila horticola]
MDQPVIAGSLWPSALLPPSMDDVRREMDVKRLLAFQANVTSTTSPKVLACEPTGHLAEGAATVTLDSGNILAANVHSSNPQSSRIDYRQQTTQHGVNAGKSGFGSRCFELSSLPHFSSSIPSPLTSPITATAASLTALSISHSSNSVSQALCTQDLTRVTVPRDKNQIPNFIIQDHRRKNRYRVSAPREQLGMSSDPETSTRPASRHGSSHKLAANEGSISTTRRRAESSTSSATVSRAANAVKSTPQLRVTLYNLVSTGYLPADTRVIFRDYSAIVTARGTLIPVYNEENWATLFPWLQGEYETPSAWATAMIKGARTGKVAVNGWSAIKVKIQQHSVLTEMFSGQRSPEVSLDVLRKRYLTDMKYHGSAQAETESAMADAGKELVDVDQTDLPL